MSAQLRILHTNDLHGTLTPELAELLAGMRGDGLLFDTGDCIKAGNLAVPVKPEAAWPLLERAGCFAGTIGNRETHLLESAFQAKLKGARHPLLCANLRYRATPRPLSLKWRVDGTCHTSPDHPLPSSLMFTQNGLKIGVIGVSVPMVTEGMKTKFASAYLWDPPIPTAIREAKHLRPQVDLLIALTHIGYKRDQQLAEACPELDIIFGGHSHTVLESPELHNGVAICQGGSHARFVGVYSWDPDSRKLTGRLEPLKPPLR